MTKKMKLTTKLVFTIFALFLLKNVNAQSWDQKGSAIYGVNSNDSYGYSTNMPNDTTLVVGAFNANSGVGYVKVYYWGGAFWKQKGSTLNGVNVDDYFGYSVNMPSENTLVVGTYGANSNTGYVNVYHWDGMEWQQKGSSLNGVNVYDYFGYSVNMPSENTLVVGAYGSNSKTGYVKVYHWDGMEWLQKGSTLNGVNEDDSFGISVNMPNETTLIVGAQRANYSEGYVKVYDWGGTDWQQKGNTLIGADSGDEFGCLVNMPSENTFVVGAYGKNSFTGYAKVYYWDGMSWQQKGGTLNGENTWDLFGYAVNMPSDNTLVIGSYNQNSGNGYVKVYSWDGANWQQKGNILDGEYNGDYFGYSVSMPSENTLVVGASSRGFSKGYVKVYKWDSPFASTVENSKESKGVEIFPNPTNKFLNVRFKENFEEELSLIILDATGRVIKEQEVVGKQTSLDLSKYQNGIYFIHLLGEKEQFTYKVVKE